MIGGAATAMASSTPSAATSTGILYGAQDGLSRLKTASAPEAIDTVMVST